MTYVVTASDRGVLIRATRVYKTSAVVLAMKLHAKGHSDVTIVDTEGQAFDLDSFQRRHLPPLRGQRLGPIS